MTLETIDHDKTLADATSEKDDPTHRKLGLIDNYKTPVGKRRLQRNQLRTIYALVWYQHECGSFDVEAMQEAVRRRTGDKKLDLKDLLLRFQDPEDDLTIAVRESIQKQGLKDDVETVWEEIKPLPLGKSPISPVQEDPSNDDLGPEHLQSVDVDGDRYAKPPRI